MEERINSFRFSFDTYTYMFFKKQFIVAEHVGMPLIPPLGRQRLVDLCEFDVSLVYIDVLAQLELCSEDLSTFFFFLIFLS